MSITYRYAVKQDEGSMRTDGVNEMRGDVPGISSQQQLDRRWIERFRQLTSYDTYWWWAQAGPFIDEEQSQWSQLIEQELDATTKEQLDRLIVRSRGRELTAAIGEQREPRFHYPILAHSLEELRQRISALHQLDVEVIQEEPDRVVRRLYHDAITEEIDYLHLIETAYTRDSDRFWELTRLLNPIPTLTEMEYPLTEVKNALLEGLRYTETRELSQSLIQFVRERFQLPALITDEEIAHECQQGAPLPPIEAKQKVPSQAVKRFFESILQEAGYTGWRVEIDPKAGGASVTAATRHLYIQEDPITLERVRHLLSHEIAGHIARSTSGEQSILGILALGTAGYMATEEGLALYNERHTALLHGEDFDDSGTWMCMLAVGLATGAVTPPQTFSSLFAFVEPFILQRRLIKRIDKDLATAKKQAHNRAISRCLRTYRGVPNLEQAGIAYTKDVVYQRGLQLIEQAVAQDETVLGRLAIGKMALQQLGDLRELNMVAPPQPLRARAFDPGLDDYILSFEEEK
jgi:hypothetical protein